MDVLVDYDRVVPGLGLSVRQRCLACFEVLGCRVERRASCDFEF